jgi:hypothetical protein
MKKATAILEKCKTTKATSRARFVLKKATLQSIQVKLSQIGISLCVISNGVLVRSLAGGLSQGLSGDML